MLFSCAKDIDQDTATTTYEAGSAVSSNEIAENAGAPYVSNEILVKFKTGVSEDTKDKAFSRIGGKVKDKILTKAMKHFGDNEGVYLVNTSVDVLEAISKVKGFEIELPSQIIFIRMMQLQMILIILMVLYGVCMVML
jgi:hypothetical protein